MANPEQIEQEIVEYLSLERNLTHADRLKYLMAIVNKHFAIDKIDHNIDRHDLLSMISMAKGNWADTTLPMEISRKEVNGPDVAHVLVVEAFINYLNRFNLLKRLVKIDYTRRRT